MGYSRAACTEFPNDNPALHRGVIWYCATVGAPASCDLPVTAESSAVLAIGRVHPIDDDAPDELSLETAEPDASDNTASVLSAGNQDGADSEVESDTGSETEGETESEDSETDMAAPETIEIVDELSFEDDADEAPASAADQTPSAADQTPSAADQTPSAADQTPSAANAEHRSGSGCAEQTRPSARRART